MTATAARAAAARAVDVAVRALESPRRQMALVVLVAAVMTALALASLRDGHYWGGDFAQYIAHAQNIATGEPYGKLDYLLTYEHGHDRIAPRIYPPMTPTILAPVVALYGIDLAAMKSALYTFFAATIVLVFLYYRRVCGAAVALMVAIAFALNPYMWWFKDRIESEFPFLFFLYLCFYLLARRDGVSSCAARLAFMVLASLAADLAYATRSVGFVIPAAVVVHEALQRRPRWGEISAFLAVFAAGAAVQFASVGSLTDYSGVALLDGWFLNLFNFAVNLAYYVAILRELFPPMPPSYLVSVLVAVCLTALLGTGLWVKAIRPTRIAFAAGWRELRTRAALLRLVDIFAILYLAVIFLYPHRQGMRFLMPVLPVVLYYVFAGLVSIIERTAASRSELKAGLLALAIHGFYYAAVGPAAIPYGVHTRESAEMFRIVRTKLPEDSLVVFRKPRVMALFGQRRSTIWPFDWPHESTREAAWRYFAQSGVTHIVLGNQAAGLDYPKSMRFDLGPPSPHLTRLFANAHFVIYRVDSYPAAVEAGGGGARG